MPANLENSAVATGLEKVSFHSNPKERQSKRMLKLPKVVLTSHASNIMFKILQARLLQYVNRELPDVLVRESVPRQIDRESRGPQGEKGLEFSRRKKGQTFFLSPHSLGLYPA